MKYIYYLFIFFCSCNGQLKESFIDEWIEGVPPKPEDIDYYKIQDYYVVYRTDINGDGFVTNNKTGKEKTLINLNYFDKEKVQILLDQYQLLKEENNELIRASYFKGNELSYMTTRLNGFFFSQLQLFI